MWLSGFREHKTVLRRTFFKRNERWKQQQGKEIRLFPTRTQTPSSQHSAHQQFATKPKNFPRRRLQKLEPQFSLPLWSKFSFSSTETAVVSFMYLRIGSRDKYNKNYIASIVALRRLAAIYVFGENRVDVTRMRYMLIQSARRWINKFPRRARIGEYA